MNKVLVFTIILLILIFFGYFVLTLRPDLKSQERSGLVEDNLVSQDVGLKVAPLILNDQTIEFPHTDNNDNESIIIKSDKDRYTSFAGSDVYFSVTNTSDLEEDGILLFHFDQNFKRSADDPSGITKPRVYSLEQRTDNNWSKHNLIYNNISINATKLAQALDKKKDIPETFDVSAGTQFKLAPNQTAYFKAKISYPPGSEGEFWIETLGENGGYGLLDPWYASTYTHRKRITIDNAMVSGGADLSNFPLLVSLNNDLSLKGTDFGGRVASGAGEFVFTSSNGTTKLDHEVEYYSLSSGTIIAWVEVPTLATATDTILYLYFGGPTTGATNQNPTGVWDSSYKLVAHLPDGSTLSARNSKGVNNGTITGATATEGKIYGAGSFTAASSHKIDFGDIDTLDGLTALTVSAWVKFTTLVDFQEIFSKQPDGNNGWGLVTGGSGVGDNKEIIAIARHTDGVGMGYTADDVIAAGRWYYIVQRYDGAGTGDAGKLKLYIDGVEKTLTLGTIPTSLPSNASTVVLGFNNSAGSIYLNGVIDEARASDTPRSAGWIATEYNNQNSPSTYVTAEGAEKEIRTAPDAKVKGGVKFKGGVEVK